jgi:hypothetical protein
MRVFILKKIYSSNFMSTLSLKLIKARRRRGNSLTRFYHATTVPIATQHAIRTRQGTGLLHFISVTINTVNIKSITLRNCITNFVVSVN